MQKLILLSIALSSLAVSCNEDSTSESALPSKEVISFENLFIDKSTRSIVDPSTDLKNLDIMTVYDYMDSPDNVAFNNQEVKIANGKGTYNPPQYWETGHKYVFAAVSPVECENHVIQHNGGEIKSLTITNTGDSDLLFATAETTTPADLQHRG